jgi:hypothetical protein
MKTTIHRVIRRERGLILMSIPRRETGFLGNTKVCPVTLAAREKLLSTNVVPVRVSLPAFLYVAFERTLKFCICSVQLHYCTICLRRCLKPEVWRKCVSITLPWFFLNSDLKVLCSNMAVGMELSLEIGWGFKTPLLSVFSSYGNS